MNFKWDHHHIDKSIFNQNMLSCTYQSVTLLTTKPFFCFYQERDYKNQNRIYRTWTPEGAINKKTEAAERKTQGSLKYFVSNASGEITRMGCLGVHKIVLVFMRLKSWRKPSQLLSFSFLSNASEEDAVPKSIKLACPSTLACPSINNHFQNLNRLMLNGPTHDLAKNWITGCAC